jgi:hypothetical protein
MKPDRSEIIAAVQAQRKSGGAAPSIASMAALSGGGVKVSTPSMSSLSMIDQLQQQQHFSSGHQHSPSSLSPSASLSFFDHHLPLSNHSSENQQQHVGLFIPPSLLEKLPEQQQLAKAAADSSTGEAAGSSQAAAGTGGTWAFEEWKQGGKESTDEKGVTPFGVDAAGPLFKSSSLNHPNEKKQVRNPAAPGEEEEEKSMSSYGSETTFGKEMMNAVAKVADFNPEERERTLSF